MDKQMEKVYDQLGISVIKKWYDKHGMKMIGENEVEWMIEQVEILEKIEKQNKLLTERFHKQADYIINLEAKLTRCEKSNK